MPLKLNVGLSRKVGEPHFGSRGASGNGPANGAVRLATPSQVRAIHAIARRQQLDLAPLLRQQFNIDHPDLLSVQDASTLIDDLEGRTPGDPTTEFRR